MNPAGESEGHGEAVTFFDAVGGEPTFRRLVEEFYAGIAADPLLRPMYPEEDLGPAADRMRLFLMQYWGGPNTYSAQRGHPRLRMRHAPFRIGAAERDAWLGHMRRAVDASTCLRRSPRNCGTTWSGRRTSWSTTCRTRPHTADRHPATRRGRWRNPGQSRAPSSCSQSTKLVATAAPQSSNSTSSASWAPAASGTCNSA